MVLKWKAFYKSIPTYIATVFILFLNDIFTFINHLPIFALPNPSLKIAGCGCLIFIRLCCGSLARFLLGCSTGNTRLRFFGNLDLA